MSFSDKCALAICAVWVTYSVVAAFFFYIVAPETVEALFGSLVMEWFRSDLSKSLMIGGFGTLVPFTIAGIYFTFRPPNNENKTTTQQRREQK